MSLQHNLKSIANILRRDSMEMTTAAKSGHPTSCLSCAEIMASLFFHHMKYDVKNPDNPNNDQFILSKGHSAPILYAALYRAGAIKDNLRSLRKLSSRLEGHPNPRSFPWAKVGTGSLGQGLSVGIGMALAAKVQKRSYYTYVLMGDGEIAEGSVYEAAELAGHFRLDNIVAIVDVNRLGQTGQTMVGHKMRKYKKRFEGFGWKTYVVNGHNTKAVLKTLARAKNQKKPAIILAKTYKGKGISFIENKDDWHGKALDEAQLVKALKEISDTLMPSFHIKKPVGGKINTTKKVAVKTSFKKDTATREAYGVALAYIAKENKQVMALDGEVSNSTKAAEIKKVDVNRFVECYIAEQNMVGMALGLAAQQIPVFCSTFAAFFTRAHDQLRMAALSKANMNFVGSHAGVSIGKDGVSQMGLDDIAMFRGLPNSIVLYPSDAVSTAKLTGSMLGIKELCYLRTTRADTPILYKNSSSFPIGKYKLVKNDSKAAYVLVGAGITLHECLKAYEVLKKKGKKVIVVDAYTIKPFPVKDFRQLVKGKKVIVAEDHYEQGGLGEVIKSALSGTGTKVKHLCIRAIPHSGTPEELLHKYEIDKDAIVKSTLAQ